MKLLSLFALTIVVAVLISSTSYAIIIPVDTLTDEKQKINQAVNVVNNTDYDVEDIILWASDYLGIRNVTICVGYQRKLFKEEGMLVKHDNIYFLYLKKKLVSFRTVIMHELVHIKQYEEKELVSINPHTVSYKGYVINLHRIDYLRRPYELEAHSEDSKILRKYFKYKKELRRASREQTHSSEGSCTLASNNAED